MPIQVMPVSSPELGRRFNRMVDELAYAIGAEFDFNTAPLGRSGTLILNLIAVEPSRGAIPNGTRFRRSDNEFKSSFNIDYARWVAGDLAEQVDAVCDAYLGALGQTPSAWLPVDTLQRFKAALPNGRQRLLAEPDRLEA